MHNNKVEHDNLIYTFRPYVEELHPLINCVFDLTRTLCDDDNDIYIHDRSNMTFFCLLNIYISCYLNRVELFLYNLFFFLSFEL